MKIDSAWPNKAQLTLLKAALFPPDQAISHWEEFLASYDLQNLDHGCNQILPMVYINLKERMKRDINEKTCRSAYKYVWAKNHLIMHDAKALLDILKEHELEVCLLKGAAYIGHYFPNYGMRTLGDIDLLVSPQEMPKLVNILEENDYKVKLDLGLVDAHSLLRGFHARSFVNHRGSDFDVHQYLSPFLVDGHFSARVWENKRLIDLFHRDDLTFVLSPTYQLLHTILHGLQYAPESSIRWIVDATSLLKRHSGDIDWEELKDVCSTHHLNLPMSLALIFLSEELMLPIPQSIVSHFKAVKITNKDQDYFSSSSKIGFRYTVERIKRSWEHYKIYVPGKPGKTHFFGFYDFLLVYLNLKSRWMLVPYVVMKTTGVLWRTMQEFIKRLIS